MSDQQYRLKYRLYGVWDFDAVPVEYHSGWKAPIGMAIEYCALFKYRAAEERVFVDCWPVPVALSETPP